MVKANKKFDLSIRDIEIIEQALRAKAGRSGLVLQTEKHLLNLKKSCVNYKNY